MLLLWTIVHIFYMVAFLTLICSEMKEKILFIEIDDDKYSPHKMQ